MSSNGGRETSDLVTSRRWVSLALLLGALLLLDGCGVARPLESMANLKPGECVLCGRVRATAFGSPVPRWDGWSGLRGEYRFRFWIHGTADLGKDDSPKGDFILEDREEDGVFALAIPAGRWRIYSDFEVQKELPLGGDQRLDSAEVTGLWAVMYSAPSGGSYVTWKNKGHDPLLDDAFLYQGRLFEAGKVYCIGDRQLSMSATTNGDKECNFSTDKKIVYTVAPDLGAALQARYGIDPASIIPADR
jgi:hypothetical protein